MTGRELKYDAKEQVAYDMLRTFLDNHFNPLLDAIGAYLANKSQFNKKFKTPELRQLEYQLTVMIKSKLAPVVYTLDTITKGMDDIEVRQDMVELINLNRKIMGQESLDATDLEATRERLSRVIAKVMLSNIMIAPKSTSRAALLGDYEVT